MYCNYCGKEIKAESKFCSHCGKQVNDRNVSYGIDASGGWVCPDCNSKNINASKFCTSCGKPNPYIVICTGCNNEYRDQERFCPVCGSQLTWKLIYKQCQKCNTRNALDSIYCSGCGSALENN